MKSYKYVARDASGARKQGFSQAACANDVLSWLREQALTPISVTELKDKPGKKQQVSTRRRRIKSADLSAIFWQLTTMVEGGIGITNALESMSEDIEHAQLKQILEHIREKMQKGEPFSDCLADYPKVFNKLVRAIVLAGETGGTLYISLRRVAEYFDNRDKLGKKVKGAMAYPIFVLVFIVAIVIFIMTFIVPRFQLIFDQFGGDLPAFTKGFMGVYEILHGNILYMLALLFIAFVAVTAYSKTRTGHRVLSKIVLRIPLFGKIVSQAFIAMFCRTMSTLLAAGVSVLDVFDILSEMTGNDIIRQEVAQSRERIVGGSSVSKSMADSGFFPNMVVKMVQIGEESGSMKNVLERTANYYDRKVDSTISTLTGLMEPIMILTVGAIVLMVVLALYMPIFSMSPG